MSTADEIKKKFDKISATVVEKNNIYGDIVTSNPVLCPQVTPIYAMLVRLSDKISRVKQLLESDADNKVELIDATLEDVAGYSVLLSLCLESSDL
ncbi:MAG: hypothetical protein LBQ54_05700 [Planctomycetaceae bacterium]|nr:hypothetical protein [Planctomycetaceae bacterium]